MTITELIRLLEDVRIAHGDIEVMWYAYTVGDHVPVTALAVGQTGEGVKYVEVW